MSKQPKDIGHELRKVLEQIESPDPQDRHAGYTKLEHDAQFLHGRIPKEYVPRLLAAFFNETRSDLHERAHRALLTLLLMPAQGPSRLPVDTADDDEPKRPTLKKCLGEWLFEPFLQKSAVISVYDAEKYRRDEHAELFLGRRLSFDRNRPTEFIHFSAADPRAHLTLPNRSFKAVCVVGRPGLFGEQWFLPLIRYPSIPGGDPQAAEALRFGFDVHHRSPDLPHNQIDPAYHHLVERKGDGATELLHTVDDGRSRRDFGLVQRYSVEIGGQSTVIVVVAGASSLGTLGAAQWATLALFPDPDDPESDDAVIPLPDALRSEAKRTDARRTDAKRPETKRPAARMEALVQVTADSTQGAWESPNVELLKLSIDDETWSPADRRWLPTPPDEVTLVYRDKNLTRILFDRLPHAFGNPSQMSALTKALAEAAGQGRAQWSLDELRADNAAWGLKADAPRIEADTAAGQLRLLRQRHLGTALAVEGDQVYWRCRVRRTHET